MEDVMLLSDGIINQSVPLILCQEEDVEGNHGASIGRLSRELLFYLESRGIPEADLYELLAKARLDAVINLIPDPETQEKLRQEEGESLC
jgi:Fe-S cluster assembly scaffold protein SufB